MQTTQLRGDDFFKVLWAGRTTMAGEEHLESLQRSGRQARSVPLPEGCTDSSDDEQISPGEEFVTRAFDNRDEVIAWLTATTQAIGR